MRLAFTTAAQGAFMMSGVLSIVVAGVGLHVDNHLEGYFIEVHPEHDRATLREAAGLAEELGYEIMPEWECPAEHLPSGVVRHWLAMKEEVIHDSGPV
jgi:hypothetical protein